jgi:putative ABC transport system substrate-binding protein
MRRRDLVTALGAALAVPGSYAVAEAPAKRRIGALFSQAEGDPEGLARLAAFRQGLQELGWTDGANMRLEARWAGGSHERLREHAASLAAQSEVILASATGALAALQRATRSVPIVFAQVTDPVAAGFVASLARPGGNITGLTQHEFEVSGKWLDLLKQIDPRVTRAAVLYDPANPAIEGYLRVMRLAAGQAAVALFPFPISDQGAISRAFETFAKEPNGGVILLPGTVGTVHRDQIIGMAARHRMPSIFAFPYHVASGGLASYGVDNIDLFRRAARFVDRILKGVKPGDLPVEHATKFRLVINLKTAKALGLDVPLALLTSADEVIE